MSWSSVFDLLEAGSSANGGGCNGGWGATATIGGTVTMVGAACGRIATGCIPGRDIIGVGTSVRWGGAPIGTIGFTTNGESCGGFWIVLAVDAYVVVGGGLGIDGPIRLAAESSSRRPWLRWIALICSSIVILANAFFDVFSAKKIRTKIWWYV